MVHHRHHHHHHHADGQVHVHVETQSTTGADHHHAAPSDGEDASLLEAAFIEGFRSATDKAVFLRLAGVPHHMPGKDGEGLKLFEVRISDHYEVGSAAPGFGTSELVYHPFPGAMVRRATRLRFVYGSLRETRELTWAEIKGASGAE